MTWFRPSRVADKVPELAQFSVRTANRLTFLATPYLVPPIMAATNVPWPAQSVKSPLYAVKDWVTRETSDTAGLTPLSTTYTASCVGDSSGHVVGVGEREKGCGRAGSQSYTRSWSHTTATANADTLLMVMTISQLVRSNRSLAVLTTAV